ncbi:MAG: hypothetical protein Q9170_005046 [Blastenia crenularia]
MPSTWKYTDYEILSFILSLEHFQDAYYRQGLTNFTQAQIAEAGYGADFYTNLTNITSQEHTLVTSATSMLFELDVVLVEECTYFFNLTSLTVFVQAASLIEAVILSSYIGLLGNLRDAVYLKVFSSVLAVEARHSSFIRATMGVQLFLSPYDTPTQLYKIVIDNKVIFITYGKDIKVGSDSTPLYAAFFTLTDPVCSPTIRLPNNGGFNITVPGTPKDYVPINGLTYVVVSSSNTSLTDDNIVARPATIEMYLE